MVSALPPYSCGRNDGVACAAVVSTRPTSVSLHWGMLWGERVALRAFVLLICRNEADRL